MEAVDGNLQEQYDLPPKNPSSKDAQQDEQTRRSIQEKIRVALYVQKAARQYIDGVQEDEKPLLADQQPCNGAEDGQEIGGEALEVETSGVAAEGDIEMGQQQSSIADTPAGRQYQVEVDNQRKRCVKYSQKALQFEVALVVYLGSASSSSGRSTAVTVLAVVALIIAILVDLVSCRLKPKWGHALVYLSSFSLVLTTVFLFVSCNKAYLYAVVAVLLVCGACFLEHKLTPHHGHGHGHGRGEQQQRSTTDQELDSMFDEAALVLSLESVATVIVNFIKSLKHRVTTFIVGFSFFLTLLVAMSIVVLTTVRSDKLPLRRAKLLDLLLRILVFLTVLVTCIKLFTG